MYSPSSFGMSLRGLAEPNSEPTTCFSISVSMSRLGSTIVVSVTGWMLVTTIFAALAAEPERLAEHLAVADAHGHDDLVAAIGPT